MNILKEEEEEVVFLGWREPLFLHGSRSVLIIMREAPEAAQRD